MAGPGSGSNILSALASFFIPGLGQLFQGRIRMAMLQFGLAIVLWLFSAGWIVHFWSIIDAAIYDPHKRLAR